MLKNIIEHTTFFLSNVPYLPKVSPKGIGEWNRVSPVSPDALSAKHRNCLSRKSAVRSSCNTTTLVGVSLSRFADEAIGASLISIPPSKPMTPFDSFKADPRGGSKGSMAERIAAQPRSLVSKSGPVLLELTTPPPIRE